MSHVDDNSLPSIIIDATLKAIEHTIAETNSTIALATRKDVTDATAPLATTAGIQTITQSLDSNQQTLLTTISTKAEKTDISAVTSTLTTVTAGQKADVLAAINTKADKTDIKDWATQSSVNNLPTTEQFDAKIDDLPAVLEQNIRDHASEIGKALSGIIVQGGKTALTEIFTSDLQAIIIETGVNAISEAMQPKFDLIAAQNSIIIQDGKTAIDEAVEKISIVVQDGFAAQNAIITELSQTLSDQIDALSRKVTQDDDCDSAHIIANNFFHAALYTSVGVGAGLAIHAALPAVAVATVAIAGTLALEAAWNYGIEPLLHC
jgi:hypothetical protein